MAKETNRSSKAKVTKVCTDFVPSIEENYVKNVGAIFLMEKVDVLPYIEVWEN